MIKSIISTIFLQFSRGGNYDSLNEGERKNVRIIIFVLIIVVMIGAIISYQISQNKRNKKRKMTLARFEKEVLRQFLKNKLTTDKLDRIISNGLITNYEYTGAGYFLELSVENSNLKNETLHEPIIIGRLGELNVGFLLYTEQDKITIECHNWGVINPPENIRELDLEIIIEKK